MTCSKCSSKISDKAKICPCCGVDLNESLMDDSIKEIKRKNKARKNIIMAIIAVVLVSFVIMAVIVIKHEKQEEIERKELYRQIGEELTENMNKSLNDYNENVDSIIQDIEEKRREFEETH